MYPFVISLRNLRLARGAKVLIEAATLQIHPGWKVGLTGANGSGKSSLFAMLRDQLHPDQGDLDMPPGWVMQAARQAALGKARSLRYVDTILRAWSAKYRPHELPWLIERQGRQQRPARDRPRTFMEKAEAMLCQH